MKIRPTILEILTPKPEARPRIYANSIADKAHAKAPTARPKLSLGHRPGYLNRNPNPNPALKGRTILCLNLSRIYAYLMNDMFGIERQNGSPFQGCWILLVPVPRALPWAGISRPVAPSGLL